MRSFFVDLTPLRTSIGFRWLFVGLLSGGFARQILVVAVPFEIFVRTDSTMLVGLAGLVQVLPLVFFSLVGGVIADAMDRARILMFVEAGICVTAVLLALNAGTSNVWPIFVLVALNAAFFGLENPTRTAMVPSLVEPGQLATAFALNQSLTQLMFIVGPAAAGLIIASSGVQVAYYIAAISSAATIAAWWQLRGRKAVAAVRDLSMRAIVDGWKFLRGQPMLMQLMLIDLVAMVFGLPRALFPVIGTVTLDGDAATVGLLYAAPGVGALIAAVTAGWVNKVKRQGRAVIWSVVGWGVAIAGFGFARTVPLALFLLACAGAADVISNVFRSTVLQAAVPDHLRGRVTAFKAALSGSASPLGDAESGTVATVTTPTFATVSGGLASAAGAVVIACVGGYLWRQHVDDPVPATNAGPGPSV